MSDIQQLEARVVALESTARTARLCIGAALILAVLAASTAVYATCHSRDQIEEVREEARAAAHAAATAAPGSLLMAAEMRLRKIEFQVQELREADATRAK